MTLLLESCVYSRIAVHFWIWTSKNESKYTSFSSHLSIFIFGRPNMIFFSKSVSASIHFWIWMKLMVMMVSEYVMSTYPFSNLDIQIHMKEKVVVTKNHYSSSHKKMRDKAWVSPTTWLEWVKTTQKSHPNSKEDGWNYHPNSNLDNLLN